MRGLPRGELFEKYYSHVYNIAAINTRVSTLLADTQIDNYKGVNAYVLGRESDPSLLSIRMKEEKTKQAVYKKQTDKAKAKGVSNCPLYAIGHDSNRARIYKLSEMDADHVTA